MEKQPPRPAVGTAPEADMLDALNAALAFRMRDIPPADLAAFHLAISRLTGMWLHLVFWVFAGAALIWWLLDPWVFEGRHDVQAVFVRFRLTVIGVAVALSAVSLATPWVRRWPNVATWMASVVLSGGCGWWIGAVQDPDGSWFAYLYVVALPTVLFAVQPLHRVLFVSTVCGAACVGYFAHDLGRIDNPDVLPTLSSFVFTGALAVLMGHITYRVFFRFFVLQRRSNDQALVLARQAEELAELSRTLEERVAQKSADLRTFARRLDNLRNDERRWLALEIHDHLGQELTALRFAVSLARTRPADGVAVALGELENLIARCQRSMRRIIERLRPELLDALGFEGALCALADKLGTLHSLEIDVHVDEDIALPDEHETTFFAIAEEGLTNVVKHAAATRVEVRLARGEGRAIVLVVADDGRGMGEAREGGVGCIGIRERVEALGGAASWSPRRDGGTRLEVSAPVPATPVNP